MKNRVSAILLFLLVLSFLFSCSGSTSSPTSAKTITTFSFANTSATGIIDENARTISVLVPYGTDVTALTAIFNTTGARVRVGSIDQISGTTPNNFINPVEYKVIAEDTSTASYTVCVTLENYIHLQSDSGDYIGDGQTYTYTQASARITISATGGHFSIIIAGDQDWSGDFQVPSSLSLLQPGSYGNLTRYPFNNPVHGGLDWSGEGRGCNTLTGSFVVENVTYTNENLLAVDLSFEQHCEDASPALHGRIHWTPNDTSSPPGPVNPPPAGLWRPISGSTPTIGNYVYLQSDSGDYIGGGQTYTYTQTSAQITIDATGGYLSIIVAGDQDWWGDFQTMTSLSRPQPGYYGNLGRYPFNNPVRGGLGWWGEGRSCSTLTGWFVVDNVTYSNGSLTAIDLRFEQHCEGETPALHGQIHWTPNDSTSPPGPVSPPPAGLWQPVPGSTPTIGSYVYLQSDSGDYIGGGQTYTYTQANANITVSATNGHFSISIDGDQYWAGAFQTMNSLSQLQPGYYGNLERYPFNNPVRGGLDWWGAGRSCSTLTGWFVIDNVTYSNGILTAIDLRFEQHCEGDTPALHGQIQWIQ